MNRFFNFSSAQLKVIIFLVILLVTVSVYKFIKGYSEIDERSLKFNVSIGDDDTRYPPPFKVDLNLSPADSLELLPGIGPAISRRIVRYRQEFGRFETVDDLVRVRGIGTSKLDDIRSMITVGGK